MTSKKRAFCGSRLQDGVVGASIQPRLMRHRASKRICSPRASPEQLYNQDIWSCIASFLDEKDLENLALTARFFVPIARDERLWKALCLKRLCLGETTTDFRSDFSWKALYGAAFDGSHSYSIHDSSKNRDHTRTGAFIIVSGKALAAGRLWQRVSKAKKRKIDESSALTLVSNVKNGIWLADLHLLRCPRCDCTKCQGTMQTLEFRHWELFLHEEYRNGSWSYHEIADRKIKENMDAAAGALFDYQRLVERSQANSAILNFKSWVPAADDFQPVGTTSLFGAAACSNLLPNEGLGVKFYVMTAGKGGPVLSIRISQQLL